MRELIFVTSNENKAREMAHLLGVAVKRRALELDEIQEMDLKKIVGHKAKQAHEKLGVPALVEDVGLYMEEWNGFPGPFVKWMGDAIGYDVFPAMVRKNRQAEWVCMLGLYDGRKLHLFEGITKGIIAKSPKGTDGWGFDTIFIPEGAHKTYAELGGSVKHATSARAKAVQKLRRFIKRK